MITAGDHGRAGDRLTRPVTTRPQAVIKAAFEISPMREAQWTGIGEVVSQIAKHAMLDPQIDWMFLYDNAIIPIDLVALMLGRRGGDEIMMEALADAALSDRFIAREEELARVCVWSNVKTAAGRFRREAMIIHDLSPLLTPEFHHVDTIHHHAYRVRHDTQTSHHIFCDSAATRADVVNYLAIARENTSVLPLGVEYDLASLYCECLRSRSVPTEPYIVVLGTIEPRKNGAMVIDLLTCEPQLARDYRIVFIGRDGWLAEKERMLKRLHEAGIAPDRIVFTGFVQDQTKLRLLLNCAFAIYPSFFEGYGLPVLEAAVLGKLTVASNSSSVVEVAPDRSVFFDPTDLGSLAAAVHRAIAITRAAGDTHIAFGDIVGEIEARSWSRCYRHIAQWVQHEQAAA